MLCSGRSRRVGGRAVRWWSRGEVDLCARGVSWARQQLFAFGADALCVRRWAESASNAGLHPGLRLHLGALGCYCVVAVQEGGRGGGPGLCATSSLLQPGRMRLARWCLLMRHGSVQVVMVGFLRGMRCCVEMPLGLFGGRQRRPVLRLGRRSRRKPSPDFGLVPAVTAFVDVASLLGGIVEEPPFLSNDNVLISPGENLSFGYPDGADDGGVFVASLLRASSWRVDMWLLVVLLFCLGL